MTNSTRANDDGSNASLAIAVLMPIVAAVVVVLLAEIIRWLCLRRKSSHDGKLVVGIHVVSPDAVHMCWINSDGEVRPLYTAVESSVEPQEDCGDDCRIASACAEGFRACMLREAPIACCATVPGVSFEHGPMTGGAAGPIVSVLSGIVKAKGIFYDESDKGLDGSFGGVTVHCRSVALAAACAASYRSSAPKEQRASQVLSPHLALYVGEDETTCVVFTTAWDRDGTVCSIHVVSDGYAVPGLEGNQQSDSSVVNWVTTRLKPALNLMVAHADSINPRMVEIPVALSGLHLTHRAVIDTFSMNPRLNVWYPHRVAAVQQDNLMAFGAAMLALAHAPQPKMTFVVEKECCLVPECFRGTSLPRVVPRNESHESDLLSSVGTNDGIRPATFSPTSAPSRLTVNATPPAQGANFSRPTSAKAAGSLKPGSSIASRASLSKATDDSDVRLSRVPSDEDLHCERTSLMSPGRNDYHHRSAAAGGAEH